MLDFIDTNLFKSGETINVLVYTDYREKAKRKVHSLISGEDVIELRENYHDCIALVRKGDIKVRIRVFPLSTHHIGSRSQYALVGSEIFGQKHSEEVFHAIRGTVQAYNYLLEDEKQTISNIIIF